MLGKCADPMRTRGNSAAQEGKGDDAMDIIQLAGMVFGIPSATDSAPRHRPLIARPIRVGDRSEPAAYPPSTSYPLLMERKR